MIDPLCIATDIYLFFQGEYICGLMYQFDISVLCITGDIMLLIILVLRLISGCSHPLRLTWHFLHPGLIHVIFLFASNPKYFSSIHDSVSIGLVVAPTGYLDNIDAEVIEPPKNGM